MGKRFTASCADRGAARSFRGAWPGAAMSSPAGRAKARVRVRVELRRARRLAKAAERRALMRGRREAHRRGLDVRDVFVIDGPSKLVADHPCSRRVLRVFRAHFNGQYCPNCDIPF